MNCYYFYDLFQNSFDYFTGGGIVMLPLALNSLILWYYICERLIFFKSKKNRNNFNKYYAQSQLKKNAYKNLKIISSLTACAPLLGLLGTVTGIVSTFDVIAYYGNTNTRLLSTGISEALITTEAGLIIALPGCLFNSYFKSKAERI